MPRGRRPRSPYQAAIAALEHDFARHQEDAAKVRALIEQLSARAGIEDNAGGISGSAAVVPPKKRRRRRHKSRPAIVRKAKRRAAAQVAAVAAPEPVAAKVEPAPANTQELLDEKLRAERAKRAERMRLRRAAEKAKRAEAPRAEAPPKTKKPRKSTPAPTPPVRVDSGWHDDGSGSGVMSREIVAR